MREGTVQAIDGKSGAFFLVVVTVRVVDRVMKPDRGFDHVGVGEGAPMLPCEAEQSLDVTKIVVVPIGRRIGPHQLGADGF